MNIKLTENNGNPNGKFLFAVTFIDESDVEDSTVSIYQANDARELRKLVKEDIGGDEDAFMGSEIFNDLWESTILHQKIAKIL